MQEQSVSTKCEPYKPSVKDQVLMVIFIAVGILVAAYGGKELSTPFIGYFLGGLLFAFGISFFRAKEKRYSPVGILITLATALFFVVVYL